MAAVMNEHTTYCVWAKEAETNYFDDKISTLVSIDESLCYDSFIYVNGFSGIFLCNDSDIYIERSITIDQWTQSIYQKITNVADELGLMVWSENVSDIHAFLFSPGSGE